jgi:hypothetical protein
MNIKKCGKLAVLERLPGSKYRCVCDCGTERVVSVGHFNASYFKSCGCDVWHGMRKTREYAAWGNMIARCHNPKNKRYDDYGGSGIVVCDRWRNSFKDFYADMGKCPDGFQLDRKDNAGIYEPENCRWVSPKTNIANRSISKIFIIDGVEYLSSTEAAFKLGVSENTIIAWCKGRSVKAFLKKTKKYTTRNYAPKIGCSIRNVY